MTSFSIKNHMKQKTQVSVDGLDHVESHVILQNGSFEQLATQNRKCLIGEYTKGAA